MPIDRSYALRGKTNTSLSERVFAVLQRDHEQAYNLRELQAAVYGPTSDGDPIQNAANGLQLMVALNSLIREDKVLASRVEDEGGSVEVYYMVAKV